MPASAARDLSRRCSASGTFRIWIIADMLTTCIHLLRMSIYLVRCRRSATAAASPPFGGSAPCRPGLRAGLLAKLAREGRFDYLFVESMGISAPPAAQPRLGRRTALTFPLVP